MLDIFNSEGLLVVFAVVPVWSRYVLSIRLSSGDIRLISVMYDCLVTFGFRSSVRLSPRVVTYGFGICGPETRIPASAPPARTVHSVTPSG